MTTTVLERPINKNAVEDLDLPTEWLGHDVEMRIIDEHKKKIAKEPGVSDELWEKIRKKATFIKLKTDPKTGTLIIPNDASDDAKEWLTYDD
jgi:hypothetical protein